MEYRRAIVTTLAVLGLAAGSPLYAQDAASEPDDGIEIVGVVQDLTSGAIIPAASIQLNPISEGLSPFQTLTDEEGRFRFEVVPTGEFTLEVQALGFHEMAEPVEIGREGPVEVRIEIVPQALELDPVVVTALQRGYLDRAGFYDRQRRGSGTHLTRDEFLARASFQVSDVFRSIPGTRVIRRPGPGLTADVAFRGGCVPDLFVDGIQTVQGTSVDDVLALQDVEGIEVYRGPGAAPSQYSRGTCGSILIWTREPGGGDRPFSWRRMAAGAGFVLGALLLTR
jgi:hypothetical protein